jgi:methionyl-tRNA formyltransferase
MKKLSLAYFGSPDFSADFLEKLINDTTINQLIEVAFVVTQADQLAGRKQVLTPTPVKMTALKHDLEVLEIKNLKLNENLKLKIENSDLVLVYAYGDLIPKELLELPKYGFINIHPSLLPKYRGPSPIATPLINGDKTTGVTIIKMDEEMDHGPIIAQESYTILNTDYRTDIEKKLTNIAFEMFKKTIPNIDHLQPKPQNHELATYTKKLSKNDGFVTFENLKFKIENSPEVLYNLFRGLSPWPGIWTLLRQGFEGQAKRLKITDMSLKDGKLMLNKVQLEGKNEVDFETFNKAYKIF